MTDHQIEMVWNALNEGEDLSKHNKPIFVSDCKEYGLLVAIFNLGWLEGHAKQS